MRFLEMKTGQATARLLGRHCLGNLRSDLDKSILSIKPFSCFLNLRCADNHLRESERTRFRLRAIEHALRYAAENTSASCFSSPSIVIAMYCSNNFSIPAGASSRLMRVHSEATGP